jgi:orotidine-5'-phosphate decarboxylase
MSAASPVFCAIDTTDPDQADRWARQLAGLVGGLKLGLEFFCANGPDAIRRVAAGGMPLFLDLKLHDIPNTVAAAMRAVVPLTPAITTIHAGGGPTMMRAAVEAAAETAERLGVARPKVVAVTVLTSIDAAELSSLGVADDPAGQVRRLALLARQAGCDGVVCSPHEVADLRALCGPDFTLVVPGIRPAGADTGDQKRVLTPRQAMERGADVLVIGRPITAAADPQAAARAIQAEIVGG